MVPNHCSGTTSVPYVVLKSSLKKLKFSILNDKKEICFFLREFKDNFIVRCSVNFKRLGNTALKLKNLHRPPRCRIWKYGEMPKSECLKSELCQKSEQITVRNLANSDFEHLGYTIPNKCVQKLNRFNAQLSKIWMFWFRFRRFWAFKAPFGLHRCETLGQVQNPNENVPFSDRMVWISDVKICPKSEQKYLDFGQMLKTQLSGTGPKVEHPRKKLV